jgi:hypothetical protein
MVHERLSLAGSASGKVSGERSDLFIETERSREALLVGGNNGKTGREP